MKRKNLRDPREKRIDESKNSVFARSCDEVNGSVVATRN